jgi:hypothetical protein
MVVLNERIGTVNDYELWTLRVDLPCSAWLDGGVVCRKPATVARVYPRHDNTVLVCPRCDTHLKDNEWAIILNYLEASNQP